MSLIILIIILLVLFPPQEKKKKTTIYKFDPVKIAKEQDRHRREQERQVDRARREQERRRKEADRLIKEQEAREAAQDRINWCQSMIDKYSALYEQTETELENNPSLTSAKQMQLQRQLLQYEEKIHKYRETMDKAYFIANK